ncbi:hypothetical protein ACHAXS_004998 [Conticribra weissflogii]
MVKSVDHLSAESAAAVLRELTLEKCASLRLDSGDHRSTASAAEADCGIYRDPFEETWRLASAAECSPAVTVSATTPRSGLKLTLSPRSPPPLKTTNSFKSDSGGGGELNPHSDPSLLIPSLTPFLPIREDDVSTPKIQLKLEPIAASGTYARVRKMARRRNILNRARVPPFPVPGTSFLGRKGTMMLAPKLARNNGDAPLSATDFEAEMSMATKAKLSIPKFEHVEGGRDDQFNKKARLSPSIKLAPRIKRFTIGGTNSASTRWPQDPECRMKSPLSYKESSQGYGNGDGNGSGNDLTTPSSMRSYVNPSIHFSSMKTPVNHKKRSHENAPVKYRSTPGSGALLGNVFDHQLNLLSMKPKDRNFLQEKGNFHISPFAMRSYHAERGDHVSSSNLAYTAQGKENIEGFEEMNDDGEDQLLTPTTQNSFLVSERPLGLARNEASSFLETHYSLARQDCHEDGSPFVLKRGLFKN